MNEVFVDTSGWASLFDVSQTNHAQTSVLYRRLRDENTRLVTTNYVVSELVALLSSPLHLPRSHIVRVVDSLKQASHIQIIHIDTMLDNEAWELLKKRLDKQWSLVDCSSFIVMQRLGLTEALTSDHHFEQAGYIRLLK